MDANDYLGKAIIDSIGYSKPRRLKELTDMKKAEKKEIDLKSDILVAIKQQYQIEKTDTKNNIKDFLKEICRLNSIDISVTQATIKEYCEVTSNNRVNPATYTIITYK